MKEAENEPEKKETLEETIRREVDENVAMQAFFKNYLPESVAHYIREFVYLKKSWLEHGAFYQRQWESKETFGIRQAWNQLEVIQQKKLFDAQCLWRAEKTHFKEIAICYDFQVWEKDVLNCPFIEPVNEEDINLYCKYLLSENTDVGIWEPNHEWQNYDDFKESTKVIDPDTPLPEWYEFADLHRGTGLLLTLPDIRGEKEKFYRKLHFTEKRKGRDEKAAENRLTQIQEKYLNYYCPPYDLDWFVRTFQGKEDIRLYEAINKWIRDVRENSEIYESALDLINKAEEPVPIKSNVDFREAIVQAANDYIAQKILATLPSVYEEYRFRIEMGLPFEPNGDKEFYEELKASYVESLINGRLLAGEPGDLNF